MIKKPVTIKTMKIYKPNIDMFYPVVEGLKDVGVQKSINQTIMNLVNELIKESGYYDNPAYTSITGGYEIKTNEKGILSLSIIIYWYAYHAAHGMTVIKSLTFDIDTGKSYSLNELFKPGADYVKVLSAIVDVQIKERNIDLLDPPFKGIRPDQDYYIADLSLVLYFQLYEITPYAAGFQYFPISVYQIQDIIDEKGPLGRMIE